MACPIVSSCSDKENMTSVNGVDSCDEDALPDTQGVSSEESLVAPPALSGPVIWGKMYSTHDCFGSIDMSKDSYAFGRSSKCDVMYLNENMHEDIMKTLSKIHFKIKRNVESSPASMVELHDCSMNGTFVNGKLVGQGNKVLLQTNDEICLSFLSVRAYVFVDSNPCSITGRVLPEAITKRFVVSRVLGAGAFGEVCLIFNKDTTCRYALKTVYKDRVSEIAGSAATYNEGRLLMELNHPNIIRAINVLDTPESMHIVLELMEGGDLLSRLRAIKQFCEDEAKFIFFQIVSALNYLHSKEISHRDLKIDNILLKANCDYPHVKLADFGMSRVVGPSLMKTFCGTPNYVAPEILRSSGKRKYTKEVDIWSCGVILYVCLSGELPFQAPNNVGGDNFSLEEQIMRGWYTFPSRTWGSVSTQAIDLVKKMMVVNPVKRVNITQVVQDPWLSDPDMRLRFENMVSNCGKWAASFNTTEPPMKKLHTSD